MSLFLVYFEIGKPVAPSALPANISRRPISLAFRGWSGRPREAMVLTDGHSSEAFIAFDRGKRQEGQGLRRSLLDYVRQRLDMGAHPHFLFATFRGLVESVTVDIAHVARVPLSKLEERLRAIERFPIRDYSEVIEVTTGAEPDVQQYQAPPTTKILVDISLESAALGPDPLCWKGSIDVLAGDTLLGIGRSSGSLLVLPSLRALAEAIDRLRQGARVVTTTFAGDTAPLRFVRETTGGVHAATIMYRGAESVAVPVSELDAACADAMRRWMSGLSAEQRVALTGERAGKTLEVIASAWPEVRPSS